MVTKNDKKNFFSPLSFVAVFVSGIGKKKTGSGINIPDPQHCQKHTDPEHW